MNPSQYLEVDEAQAVLQDYIHFTHRIVLSSFSVLRAPCAFSLNISIFSAMGRETKTERDNHTSVDRFVDGTHNFCGFSLAAPDLLTCCFSVVFTLYRKTDDLCVFNDHFRDK